MCHCSNIGKRRRIRVSTQSNSHCSCQYSYSQPFNHESCTLTYKLSQPLLSLVYPIYTHFGFISKFDIGDHCYSENLSKRLPSWVTTSLLRPHVKTTCVDVKRFLVKDVPTGTGSPSHGGCVAVYVFDINQVSLPTPFHSVLVSVSAFMALSTVFYSINSPINSPLSYSVLPILFLP